MTLVISYSLLFFSLQQVVQEYERAVIFRLGRLLSGGSRGPGRSHLDFSSLDTVVRHYTLIMLLQITKRTSRTIVKLR